MTSKQAIDDLVERFFSLFATRPEGQVQLNEIYELCIEKCIIIKNVDGQNEINDLNSFIEPREQLLNSGTLLNFSESEVWEETKVFGHIAQRFCVYEKSGILDGDPFEAKGMKTFQFINTPDGWKISALAWDDETETQKISVS